MKTSPISFAQLRQMLRDLHFTEARKEAGWRFDHPASKTIFLFRLYAPDEHVSMHDLVATRMQLDWRGLLPADTFDHSLSKTPA